MDGFSVLHTIKRFIKSHFFLLLLIGIAIVVAVLNYEPGIWLTGWDTLHPEFNFGLNLRRMLFGAWRDDQGLGAVAIHAHMSDLPRILSMIFIWILVPLKSIKMVYVLLCLVLGPIGVFFFIRELLSKQLNNYSFAASAAAFLGGLLYLFNLGTVQHFYVVFEMFAVQYAAIGWLFYLTYTYLKTKKSKTLLLFFIVSFLATPMAYASLLWFAYAASLGLYILSSIIVSKDTKETFVRGVTIGVVTLCANLFWLLPNIYLFFSDASKIPQNSHINSLFSEEAFLHNQAYGNLENVALLKNFLFNWSNYDFSKGEFVQLLNAWSSHLLRPEVLAIGYLVAVVVLLGLLLSFFKKQKQIIVLFPSFLFSLLMIINANGFMEAPFNWLRNNNNLFSEALRFPFTKFSIVLMLISVVFFANVVFQMIAFLSKKSTFIALIFITIISGGLFWYSAPMLRGEVIGDLMTNQIPDEYFDFYSWADTQPSTARMALFPVYSYAGWEYHEWGYEGPGFNWFALKQPVLTRDFDRWNPGNEAFYNQVSTALYQKNTVAFLNTFSQYDVSYVVIDESIILPNQDSQLLKFSQTKELLVAAGAELIWSGEFISVYDVSHANNLVDDSFVSSVPTAIDVLLPQNYLKYDPIYNTHSNYLSSKDASDTQIEFPFTSFAQTSLPHAVTYTTQENGFTSVEYLNTYNEVQNKRVTLPKFTIGETYSFPVTIEKKQEEITLLVYFPYQLYTDTNPVIKNPYLEKKIILNKDYENVSVIINGNPFEVLNSTTPILGVVDITIGESSQVVFYGSSSEENENAIPQILEQQVDLQSDILEYLESEILDANSEMRSFTELKLEFLTKENSIDIEHSGRELNCSRLEVGEIDKEVSQNETVYRAENLGAICDATLIGKLNSDYILRVGGAGISGRGSKLMVNSWNPEKPKIEEMLPQNKFDVSYGITQNSIEKVGQSVSLETRSFGKRVSENSINFLNYYAAPLSLLYSISLQPELSGTYAGADILSTHKFGNSFYLVETAQNATANEQQFIYLSQSYDSGWKAFVISNGLNSLAEHLTYNGWANAWVLPNEQSKIILIYWPQLLQFAGFIVLIASGLSLWIKSSTAR